MMGRAHRRLVVLVVWALCLGAAVGLGSEKCTRTPSNSRVAKTPGDNGFKITISGNRNTYIPGDVHTVSVKGYRVQHSTQKFTEFMLVVEPSNVPTDLYGPQSVGTFQLYGDSLTMHSEYCPNAVTHTSSIPKNEIQVMWTAPPAGSGCVRFRATVVEHRDVWYMDDGELTKELCEDVQDTVEQESEVIYDCCACNEAKYEVTFEGLWSRQTHPKDFPTNEWLTHFSDIIGASHSADYRVWEYGGYASDGLRQVAEWGSTRTLESELKRQSDHIRTIIKARGAWYPNVNGKTFAVFRVDNQHHLMSLVSMLGPTPDWIVGVSALELCLANCSWVAQKTLNLYPWDAGTDSGVTYMSPNQPTIPRERIRRITSSYPNNPDSPFYEPSGAPMKPLARLTVTRQRVYEKSCSEKGYSTFDEGPGYEISDEDADRPECAVSEWSLFTQCSASCGEGLRKRERTYILPMKAQMAECKRQLVEKEVCAGEIDVCDEGHDFINSKICMTSEWSSWSRCPVTCGKGFMMRNRHYQNRMGRKKCALELVEKKICMGAVPECPRGVDEVINPECTVTEWSDWSPCSATCGTGVSGRTRQFLIPSEDQKFCNVSLMDKRQCHADRADCNFDPAEAKVVCMQEQEPGPCRGYFPRYYYNVSRGMCVQFIYGGCRGNKNNFKHYDECTRMCEFSGPLVSTERHAPAYADIDSSRPQPVDCMVTEWSSWSACSTTCGKGHASKTRMIKLEPQNGGRHCPKKLYRKRKCKENPRCSKHGGLVSLSREAHIPEQHKYLPPVQHTSYPYKAPHIESVPHIDYSSPSLFHTPEANDRRGDSKSFPGNSKLQILSLKEDSATASYNRSGSHDCVMSEWGPWSPCTQSCGSEALQQRARSKIVPSQNDGKKCGARLERRYCSLPPCHHPRG